MPEINAPAYLQGGSHTAQNDRLVLGGIYGVHTTGGVIEGFDVTPGTTGLSVEVAAGIAVVGNPAAWGGPYHVGSDSTVDVDLSAADPANPRIDAVVARVFDSAYSGSEDRWAIEVVEGAAGPAPVAPSLPDRSLLLAEVAVPAGATSVGGGDVTPADVAPSSGQFLPLAGGTMSGPINMGGNTIGNVALPPTQTGAVPKSYVDARSPLQPVLLDDNLSSNQFTINVPLTVTGGTLRSVQIDVACKTSNTTLSGVTGRFMDAAGNVDSDPGHYIGRTPRMDGNGVVTSGDREWSGGAVLGDAGNGYYNLSLRITFGGPFANAHLHAYYAGRSGNFASAPANNGWGIASGFYNDVAGFGHRFRLVLGAGNQFLANSRVLAVGTVI